VVLRKNPVLGIIFLPKTAKIVIKTKDFTEQKAAFAHLIDGSGAQE
jgi:hypothetical protein